MKPRQFLVMACFLALLITVCCAKAQSWHKTPTQQQSQANRASTPPSTGLFYYTREITERDLGGRKLWELTLLPNTISANGQHLYKKVANRLFQSAALVSSDGRNG
jgi:hypothetical protein